VTHEELERRVVRVGQVVDALVESNVPQAVVLDFCARECSVGERARREQRERSEEGRTRNLDELMVELPREERLGQLPEPELQDGGDVVDVGQVLLGQQVRALEVCVRASLSSGGARERGRERGRDESTHRGPARS